jgi:hypothetical protein
VINKVGSFIKKPFFSTICSFNHSFHSFFAYFLAIRLIPLRKSDVVYEPSGISA